MLKNKNNIFLVVALTFASIMPSLLHAQQPQSNPGVFMGVANDLGWLGKKTAEGTYKGMLKGNEIWNGYMTKGRFYFVAAAVTAWGLYNCFKVIGGIEKKYDNETSGKLCVWGKKDWNTHVAMRKNSLKVLACLKATAFDINDPRSDREKAQLLLKYIAEEMRDLQKDMKSLEDQFLVFFKFIEYLPFGWKPLGIKKNYENLIENVTQLEERNWELEHFNRIDSEMKKITKISWWHPLCLTINYGNAAAVWWKLKKNHLRLEVLRNDLDLIASNRHGVFPVVNMGNVQISYGEATFKHHLAPR